MEEKINKVDDLDNIDEEADDEIDWWDLSVVMLKQTPPLHGRGVVQQVLPHAHQVDIRVF